MENENVKVPFFKHIIMALVVTVLLIAYIIVCSLVGVKEYWCGFVFLWYFGVNNVDVTKLKEIIIGGLTGIGSAYVLTFTPAYGTMGLLATLVILVLIIALLMSERIPLVVNNATTLMLTVLTLHDLAFPDRIFNGLVGFMAGAVFFGGLIALVGYIAKMKAKKDSVA
jgi:hypothetical protein